MLRDKQIDPLMVDKLNHAKIQKTLREGKLELHKPQKGRTNGFEGQSSAKSLRGRLLFEELLSSVSARFINLQIEQIDEEIQNAMRQVLDFFQVDRCALLQSFPDKDSWTIAHCVSSPGIPPVPVGTVLPRSNSPWIYDRLVSQRKVVAFSKIDEMPAEADTDKKTLAQWGIRSDLSIPLMVGSPVDHVLAVNSVRRERDWPVEIIPRLKLLGEIFVSAIERGKAQMALQASEERVDLALSGAEVGIWAMDTETGNVWVTHTLRELFNFTPEEALTFERFIEAIHPDDREMVKESVRQSIDKQEYFIVDYRIRKSDGSIRWITARGRPYKGDRKDPARLMGVSTDTTDRRNMEILLKESQTLHSTIINSTPDMIWSVDPVQFGLLSFNSGLYNYFLASVGLKIEVGMRPEDLFPHSREYTSLWRSLYQRLLAEGPFTTEYGPTYRGNRTLRLNLNSLCSDGALFGISVFAQDITKIKEMEHQLREQLEEIKKLQCRLEKENVYLRQEIKSEMGFDKIIGSSDALEYVLFRAKQVAPTDATVIILGETGVGKGMIANAIHENSTRKDRVMVTVNCSALPANLIESELFGREKGAFTGAHARQAGRFEVADKGTIFLDEIGEMPLELQSKLLRVLQDGEFERLGSPRTVKVDVRVIASTNRDLQAEMRKGRFREDLYYRLNTFPVTIPPLRARPDDIPELANFFLDKYARKCGRRFEPVTSVAIKMLQKYNWPGNVRELEHVIERAVIISPEPVLHIEELESEDVGVNTEDSFKGFDAMAREHIMRVLQKTDWKIDGAGGAAAALGIKPGTLRFRIKKLGIKRP